MFRIFFLTMFLIATWMSCIAQADIDTTATIAISEIKVSADLFDGELKTIPASVSVLTSEQLAQQDELSVVRHLNSMPGIYMQSGTFNTNRIVIRGIGSRTPYSSNRIKAYLNEIPLTNGDGVTTLEDIDANRLGRIEVMKGPTSALYGAGLGGTIKLTTSSLGQGVNSNYQFGTFNTSKLNVSVGAKIKQGNVTGSFHRTHSDGFRENNQYNRNSIFLTADKKVRNTTLNFTLMMVDMVAQIPSSINSDTYLNSPQKAASNWLEARGYEESLRVLSGVTINQSLSQNVSHKTTLYYSFNNAYEHRPFNNLFDISNSYGVRNQFLIHKRNWEVVAGFELFSEAYSWKIKSLAIENEEILTSIKETRSYGNLFGMLNFLAFEKMKISAGVNLNRLNYEYGGLVNDFGNYSYPFIFSPRLGLNYSLSEQFHLYSSIGHGFSSPSLEETLRPNGMKNPDLKQEQGLMGEIGFRYASFDNRLFLDIVAYQISLNNLLVTKRLAEDVFTGINAGKSNHKGIELQTRYAVFDKNDFPGKLVLNVSCTYSDNVFVDFVDDGIDYSGRNLPGIPKYTMYSGLMWMPVEGLKIHINYRNVGKQYLTDDNTGETQNYQVLDGKFTYDLDLRSVLKMSVSGGINNLSNTHYSSMVLINAPSFGGAEPRYFYPGKPRNIYVGIGLQF